MVYGILSGVYSKQLLAVNATIITTVDIPVLHLFLPLNNNNIFIRKCVETQTFSYVKTWTRQEIH